MKIGIISDSHTKVKEADNAVKMLLRDGAEFFIHAGDVVELATLEILKKTNKPYVAVYGNNDAHLIVYQDNYNLVKEPYYFKVAGTKFKLMHLPYYLSNDAEVIIFGHTHRFELESVDGSLFLNPGEICARSKPTSEFVMLEITEDKFIVDYYTKHKDEDSYSISDTFSFQRQK